LFAEEIENTSDIASLSFKCLFAVTGLKQTDVNISLFQYGQQSLSYAGAIQNFRQSLVEEPQPDDQRKLTRAEALSAVKFLQET